MKEQTRWWILLGVTLAAAVGLCFAPRIAQWPEYHHFADQRTLWGIPHFMDVVSNIPFLLVAALGFIALWRQSKAGEFQDRAEMWPYLSFFTAVLLTAFGSSYYHLMPNNSTLVWDRIPMTMVVTSLVAIILMEKTDSKIGVRFLAPLLLLGIGSVVYWIWTESLGRGDLRFYGFILFYPVVLIPLVLFLFPKPFPAANELVRLAIYYSLAKFFEAKDAVVYEVTGQLSGHTIKHLLAAFSLYWVIRMMRKRKAKENPAWTWGRFPKIALGVCGVVVLVVVFLIRSVVVFPGDPHRWRLPIKPAPRTRTAEELALQARLEHHLKVIAQDIGIRHCQNPAAYEKLKAADAYIRSVWKSQGYEVQSQSYDVGREVENLYVEKKGTGKPDEILVVGAHYDGVETSPAANDNGSGVAALLELSAALAKTPTLRTIQFVAFVNEEPPFFQTEAMGSRIYASELALEKKNVVGMISLETIGCYLYGKDTQEYPWPFSLFYPNTGSFIAFVGNYSSRDWVGQCVKDFREESTFPSEGVAAPDFIQGIGWSDHWSFWQEGYPALMVTDTAPYRYKYYHTPQDTFDKIDFPHMTQVVEGLQKMVLRLAQ